MVTVAHLVEKMVAERPFLQEALAHGIVNNAALATKMIPEIEKELKKKVQFSAVNMAVRRLSEKLEKSFVAKAKFDKDTDISLKSELVEITVYKSSAIENKLKKLYDTIRSKDGAFLTITQGINEVMIITNKKYEFAILKVFSDDEVKKKISGLSSATIIIPENAFNTMGLFYLVTRALNWENINIVDIVSTFTEMTFIVKTDDAPRAFNCLRALIHKNS